MDEIIRDFDWELSRFVEYRSPFTRKEILSLGSNSSHRNIKKTKYIISFQDRMVTYHRNDNDGLDRF